MFTMYSVAVTTYMALGTSGRDCIMRQRAKLFPALQRRSVENLCYSKVTERKFLASYFVLCNEKNFY